MFTNKINNSNTSYLNTNNATPSYPRPRISVPIDIPGAANRLNRLYIHNPSRNEQSRFTQIDLDLGYSNSLESEGNSIYVTIESPPHKVGSSTFYVENESENSEAASSIPTESDEEDSIYETIDLPPPLPPRNRLSLDEIHFDSNPAYASFDDHKYETLRPKLPKRNKDQVFMDENPCYNSVDTPPLPPIRDLHFHTEFLRKYCK